MKVNEQKMLMNTLSEACRKDNISEKNISYIKTAINDTIDDISFIKAQIDKLNANVNIFDNINKPGVAKEVKIKEEKKPSYKIQSFDDINKFAESKDNNTPDILFNTKNDIMGFNNILFDNRFLMDLSVIGIPATMVKSLWVCNHPDNFIEVNIYDFVDEEGTPILSVLSNYNGRKFTCEIEHLDPIGKIVYREKFNGCYLDNEIRRGGLEYGRNEPTVFSIRIYYDGVSYEAGN